MLTPSLSSDWRRMIAKTTSGPTSRASTRPGGAVKNSPSTSGASDSETVRAPPRICTCRTQTSAIPKRTASSTQETSGPFGLTEAGGNAHAIATPMAAQQRADGGGSARMFSRAATHSEASASRIQRPGGGGDGHQEPLASIRS